MIKIDEIHMCNWKCFKGETVIKADQKGKIIILGKTGTGKTSIRHALVYLFFDRYPDGDPKHERNKKPYSSRTINEHHDNLLEHLSTPAKGKIDSDFYLRVSFYLSNGEKCILTKKIVIEDGGLKIVKSLSIDGKDSTSESYIEEMLARHFPKSLEKYMYVHIKDIRKRGETTTHDYSREMEGIMGLHKPRFIKKAIILAQEKLDKKIEEINTTNEGYQLHMNNIRDKKKEIEEIETEVTKLKAQIDDLNIAQLDNEIEQFGETIKGLLNQYNNAKDEKEKLNDKSKQFSEYLHKADLWKLLLVENLEKSKPVNEKSDEISTEDKTFLNAFINIQKQKSKIFKRLTTDTADALDNLCKSNNYDLSSFDEAIRAIDDKLLTGEIKDHINKYSDNLSELKEQDSIMDAAQTQLRLHEAPSPPDGRVVTVPFISVKLTE